MPFTFAHPAAVLWGARWHRSGLPFSAFVIGSMSPDFEYFLRLRTVSVYSHTILGILIFCLPVGLVVYVLHRWAIAPALYRNLPCAVRERLVNAPPVNNLLLHALLVSAAIMMGAATHIFWDNFTHGNGYFVAGSGTLETKIAGVPVYKFLQHGGTLLGLAFIAIWFLMQPRVRSLATPPRDRGYWPAFLIAGCAAMAGLRLIRPEFALGTLIVQGIVALFLALLVGGTLFRSRSTSADMGAQSD